MKVCTCCYDPTIKDRSPLGGFYGALINSAIVVPDDTPEISGWCGLPGISHEVLEKAGLKWKEGAWHKPDGSYIDGVYDLTAENSEFVESWEREVLADSSQVIPFLKSRPRDYSTLGKGDHTKRQAKVLLKLFDQHVLGGFDATQDSCYYGEGHFTDDYALVQFKHGMLREGPANEDEDVHETLGFDFKNLEKLREELVADQKKLEELEVDPCSDSETAKQYWYKLRRAMERSAKTLRVVTGLTSDFYGLTDSSMIDPMSAVIGCFTARHNTDCVGMGVQALYEAMLPILVNKLKTLGYPDTEETVEWDYDKSSQNRSSSVSVANVGD